MFLVVSLRRFPANSAVSLIASDSFDNALADFQCAFSSKKAHFPTQFFRLSDWDGPICSLERMCGPTASCRLSIMTMTGQTRGRDGLPPYGIGGSVLVERGIRHQIGGGVSVNLPHFWHSWRNITGKSPSIRANLNFSLPVKPQRKSFS